MKVVTAHKVLSPNTLLETDGSRVERIGRVRRRGNIARARPRIRLAIVFS